LLKLYKEKGMDAPNKKTSAYDRLLKFCGLRSKDGVKKLFAPITKAYEGTGDDEGYLFVEGILAAEEPDFEGEIMDYKSSKPHFQAWNKDFAEKTGGKSVGNLRGQHNSKIAAGLFVAMDYDDKKLSIPVTAKVVDPVEQDKVRECVYTSFSIGAHYAKKWRDGKYMRWTANPFEGSLVDFGSIPSTRGFTYRSADGKEEERVFDGGRRALREAFESLGKPLAVAEEDRIYERINKFAAAQKGLYSVSGFAQLLQSLIYFRDSIMFEREQEGDDSPVTDRVSEATEELLECLAAYTQEQVSEEIGKNSAKEKAMDIKELLETQRNTPNNAVSADKAGKGEHADNDHVRAIREAAATLEKAIASLKAATGVGGSSEGETSPKKHPDQGERERDHQNPNNNKCTSKAEDCKDDKCAEHGKGAKAGNDHDEDDKAKKEKEEKAKKEMEEAAKKKEEKAAAVGSGSDTALKRADVVQIVKETVSAEMDSKMDGKLAPIGAQLKAIGDVLQALGSAQAPTRIAARAGLTAVTKDEDNESRDREEADKSVRGLVKNGETVNAILKIRERPNFITTGTR
jgi:hypothetical protein